MFWDVDKIRHIREEKHITREKLAAMTGIPIQTLADWEQHRHSPVRVNDLQNIAIALNCYLDDFVVDGKSHLIWVVKIPGSHQTQGFLPIIII